MPETVTVHKDQIEAIVREWETDYREGRTRSAEEARALPIEQVVQETTDRWWEHLTAITQPA